MQGSEFAAPVGAMSLHGTRAVPAMTANLGDHASRLSACPPKEDNLRLIQDVMREIGGQGAVDPWAVQAHPDVRLLRSSPMSLTR
jgi:hypothetical protein